MLNLSLFYTGSVFCSNLIFNLFLQYHFEYSILACLNNINVILKLKAFENVNRLRNSINITIIILKSKGEPFENLIGIRKTIKNSLKYECQGNSTEFYKLHKFEINNSERFVDKFIGMK